MILEDALSEFLAYIEIERNLSKNTVISYKRDLRLLSNFIGKDKNVSKINIAHINNFIKSLKAQNLSNSSVIRNISTIKSFYKYMIDEGIVKENISDNIEKIKMPSRLPKALSIDEISKIIESADGTAPKDFRNRTILELLYATGARVSEIADLKIEDIDISQEFIRLFGKGSKLRVVPVGQKALEYVSKYLTDIRPKLLKENRPLVTELFINSRGNKMSRFSIFNIIKESAAKVHMENLISPHTFRHSFATHLISGGANTRVVQELLGHSSLSTTQIYTKITAEHLKEVYALSHPRA